MRKWKSRVSGIVLIIVVFCIATSVILLLRSTDVANGVTTESELITKTYYLGDEIYKYTDSNGFIHRFYFHGYSNGDPAHFILIGHSYHGGMSDMYVETYITNEFKIHDKMFKIKGCTTDNITLSVEN